VYEELRSKWEAMHPSTLAWCSGGNACPSPHLRHTPAPSQPIAFPPAAASAPGGGAYKAPHSVYNPPVSAAQHASLNAPPYSSSPGTGAYGAYGGYGGYGAASSMGAQQSSPSSAVYNPNYNSALHYNQTMNYQGAGVYPSAGDTAAPQHDHHHHHQQYAQPPAVVAQPVPMAYNNAYPNYGDKNPPPSAPPGY
jgi:hypothetical protein